jgi:type II secretory pathway pseudopilin PulG
MKTRKGLRAISLVEMLIVLTILVIMLAPMIHIYVMTTRGMAGSADELEATQLCLRVMEGLQSVSLEELPEDFSENLVSALPAPVLEKIGWEDHPDFQVVVSIETRYVEHDETSLNAVAPTAGDPRRERLLEYGELRLCRVRCSRLDQGRPGPRSLAMSTILGRHR